MVRHGTAAGRRHGVQLVVGQPSPETSPRGTARTVELVIRIVHLIDTEHRLETAFVERTVVRHEGQSLDQRLDLPPHFREHRRVVRVLVRQSVYLLTEPGVVVGLGLDERVERVGDETVAHDHHPHAAHAAALSVGGLEIDGGKILHDCSFLASKYNCSLSVYSRGIAILGDVFRGKDTATPWTLQK